MKTQADDIDEKILHVRGEKSEHNEGAKASFKGVEVSFRGHGINWSRGHGRDRGRAQNNQ